MAWLLTHTTAFAADFRMHEAAPQPIAGHPVFDLRVGLDGRVNSEPQVHPNVCAEVSPLRRWSVEACGNGAGILHQSDGADMAHFRLRAAPFMRQFGRLGVQVMGGIGFTEVQRTADAPGFRFGAAQTEQVEAAGPEVSIGLKGRYWITPHSHVALDAVVGSAYIEGAPTVMGWDSPVVPFAALTTGMGF